MRRDIIKTALVWKWIMISSWLRRALEGGCLVLFDVQKYKNGVDYSALKYLISRWTLGCSISVLVCRELIDRMILSFNCDVCI